MTFEIVLLLCLMAVAMALFCWERFPADVVALGLLLALVGTGLLPAHLAFSGFASDTVIMIAGLLILTAAMQRTGIMDLVASAVLRRAGNDPGRLLWTIMLISAGLGAFISNTASTAFFLPMVFGIARKANISPSKMLMPLAFSSIVTSSVTLISTSTNLVVSGIMTQSGMPGLAMFELAPVGVPIALVGLLYMFYVGRRLIPDRTTAAEMTEEFGVRPYLSELVIQAKSPWAGKTLGELSIGHSTGLNVLRIIRETGRPIEPRSQTTIKAGDNLIVEGRREDIVRIKDTAGVEIKADVKLSDPDLQDDEMGLVEAFVPWGSPLIGSSLKRSQFRERYGVQVLGINHRGINVVRKLSEVLIRLGDVLLLQGPRDRLARLHSDPAFQILGPMAPMEEARPLRRRAWLAASIFAAVLALATFDVMPLAVAAALGVLLVFVTGCLTPERAYAEVDWKIIVLVGSLLGLSVAMDKTGTATYLAQLIASSVGSAHPLWLLTGFFALTIALTQPMSNQAAAIVVLPVAIQTAYQIGLDPRPFAVMIALAASCSYLTPLEPACLMVYGPGRYRFMDFFKVGAGLTLLIYLIAIVLVPLLWPIKS